MAALDLSHTGGHANHARRSVEFNDSVAGTWLVVAHRIAGFGVGYIDNLVAGGCGLDWLFGEVELQVLSSPLGNGSDLDLHVPLAIIPLPEPEPLAGLAAGTALLLMFHRTRSQRNR